MKRMARPERTLVAAPAAALAALSVAVMLSVPAVALGAEQSRAGSNREALASLIETLNDAARLLVGATTASPDHSRPAVWFSTGIAPSFTIPAGHVHPHAAPLREALLNLPPPTR